MVVTAVVTTAITVAMPFAVTACGIPSGQQLKEAEPPWEATAAGDMRAAGEEEADTDDDPLNSDEFSKQAAMGKSACAVGVSGRTVWPGDFGILAAGGGHCGTTRGSGCAGTGVSR
jgi:hypothetical protein